MVTFGPFWVFLLYFIGDAVAGVLAAQRYLYGKEQGHWRGWQAGRLLVSASSFLAGWDCLRIFAGGFFDPDGTEPPLFAYSIYPLMMVHLCLVPLLMMPNTEYYYNARVLKSHEDGNPETEETGRAKTLRLVVQVIAILLALMGLHTVVVRWIVSFQLGLVKGTEFGGITTWTLVEIHTVQEMGWWIIPEAFELTGILAFANYCVIIGIALWCTVNKQPYFWIQLVCLAGQGGAVGLGNGEGGAFSYGSNLFEIVSFMGLWYADWCFLENPGKTPLNEGGADPANVELS